MADILAQTPPESSSGIRQGLWELFACFAKIGATAFGGPAMIPHLHRMAVTERQWLAEEDFRLGVAVSQAIPGATVMQLAALHRPAPAGTGGCAGRLRRVLPARFPADHRPVRPVFPVPGTARGVEFLPGPQGRGGGHHRQRRRGFRPNPRQGRGRCGAGCGRLRRISLPGQPRGHPPGGHARRGRSGAGWRESGALPGGGPGPVRSPLVRAAASRPWAGRLTLLLWTFDARLGKLVLLMMRVDVFAFGGGFSALPLMLHEVVVRQGWLSEQVFMDGIALGQVTPGPIVITAAFVGLPWPESWVLLPGRWVSFPRPS